MLAIEQFALFREQNENKKSHGSFEPRLFLFELSTFLAYRNFANREHKSAVRQL